MLFLKRHYLHDINNNVIYTLFLLDPWLWPCKDGWRRNDWLCCNTLVQSTRNHAQLDALQPNRLLCIFILKELQVCLKICPIYSTFSICAYNSNPLDIEIKIENLRLSRIEKYKIVHLSLGNITICDFCAVFCSYTSSYLFGALWWNIRQIRLSYDELILKYPWWDQTGHIYHQSIPKRSNY